jgi:hypothetical protein
MDQVWRVPVKSLKSPWGAQATLLPLPTQGLALPICPTLVVQGAYMIPLHKPKNIYLLKTLHFICWKPNHFLIAIIMKHLISIFQNCQTSLINLWFLWCEVLLNVTSLGSAQPVQLSTETLPSLLPAIAILAPRSQKPDSFFQFLIIGRVQHTHTHTQTHTHTHIFYLHIY